jgi:hypothetical protein
MRTGVPELVLSIIAVALSLIVLTVTITQCL